MTKAMRAKASGRRRNEGGSETARSQAAGQISSSFLLRTARENDVPSKNSFPPHDRRIEPLLSLSDAISYLMISRHPRDDDGNDDNDAGKSSFAASGKARSRRSLFSSKFDCDESRPIGCDFPSLSFR